MDFNTYKLIFASLTTISTRSKSLYKAHRKKKKTNKTKQTNIIRQFLVFLGKKRNQNKKPSIPNEGLVEASRPLPEKVRNKSESTISIGS